MTQKTTTFKYIITIIIIAVLQISIVKTQFIENDNLRQRRVTVSGTININNPYCGGAYPPPELINGTNFPYTNSVFYLVEAGDTTRTAIKRFKTDDNGTFEIKVNPNKYWLFHESKMMPFKKFYNQKTNNIPANSVSMDVSCYKEWYNTPDHEFNAFEDTSIFVVFGKFCFTGMNPCLQYTGPLPPR